MESEKDISGKIQALHNKAKLLLQQDYSEDQVIARLQQDGIDKQYAAMIIENLKTDDDNRAHFRSLLILGLSTTIGGIILNILSYKASANMHSSTFILFWGIVVGGIIILLKALSVYRRIL